MAGEKPAVAPVEVSDGRTVAERMLAILAELPAIGKDARNDQQKFMYRSHDAVLNALNPLLAKHGVFIVPFVLERIVDRRTTKSGTIMYEVNLHVRYTFVGAKGDEFYASAWGEGTDSGDKSTNKAMTMAFKNVLAQTFAVSTADTFDADSTTVEETVRQFDPETDLMPGGVVPKNAAKAFTEIDPLVDWGLLLDQLDAEWRELKGQKSEDFWRRAANAATWMLNVAPPSSMPPITDEQIQAGIAYAFSGTAVDVSRKEVEVDGDGAEADA